MKEFTETKNETKKRRLILFQIKFCTSERSNVVECMDFNKMLKFLKVCNRLSDQKVRGCIRFFGIDKIFAIHIIKKKMLIMWFILQRVSETVKTLS